LMGDSTVLGLNLDMFMNEHFGLRGGYERLLKMEVDGSDDATMNRFYMNAIARYQMEKYAVTPYIFGGVGNESCEDNDCPSEWFTNIGLGLGYDISSNFKLSPEIKIVNRDRACGSECGDGLTDMVMTLGATYAFGKPKVVERIVKENVIVTKEVPVEIEVPVEVCRVPSNIKDRCDNSYYVQIASLTLCPTCEVKIRDKRLRNKLRNSGYRYELYETVTKHGDRVAKVLIGPYRCKREAYAHICDIKKLFECDAFIYSKR
ncbi:MAG: outer membrane beta-barrel protein, partial [Epsilonproteobacteria bacterium]|nr:outer membrane beta-barrel protein [Campylobacterota bacterium]